MLTPTARYRFLRGFEFDAPDEQRGVVLADFTTGRATLFPHALAGPTTGTAWSLLRAICALNPNITLAPLSGWRVNAAVGQRRAYARPRPQPPVL